MPKWLFSNELQWCSSCNMGLISLNSGWGFAVSLYKTTEAYASGYPAFLHPYTRSFLQHIMLSGFSQFRSVPWFCSWKKKDDPVMGLPLYLSSFVTDGLDKKENIGMHILLSGNMVWNSATTLYFRINLSSTIIGCSNADVQIPHLDS